MKKLFASCAIATAIALGARSVGSQTPPPQPVVQATTKVTHTEIDAVGWAFSALTSYSEEDRPYIRFVYLPAWADPEWIGVMDFAVNAATSQTPTLVKADRHAGGWLLAYNLNILAPDPIQRQRLIETWDSLASKDSKFHVPSINFFEETVTVNVNQVDQRTGKTTSVPQNQTRKKEVVSAVLAPHLQQALAKHATDPSKDQRVDVLVAHLTNSPGAIYPADFLLEQLLTSARGKYPEFRQMDFTVQEGTSLGARLVKGGYFRQESKNRQAEKGALLITSGVTGKSRAILSTFGVASRLPLLTTFDFRDNKVRPDQQFFRNLIDFESQSDASEAFVGMSNGMLEFLLSDGNGNLQRTAPSDVVTDFTKPDGHTKELEMGMSCIICHAPESGYKTARNDMEFLLGSDVDYVGDEVSFEGLQLTKQQAVALVVSRYGERIDEPDGIIGRARRDYIRAVDQLTNYPITADGQTSVQRVGEKIKQIYHDYRYKLLDAQRVCLELGVKTTPESALQTLKTLVPSAPAGQQEDVMIAILKNGAHIKRDDMDAIYSEMARRAVETRPKLIKE